MINSSNLNTFTTVENLSWPVPYPSVIGVICFLIMAIQTDYHSFLEGQLERVMTKKLCWMFSQLINIMKAYTVSLQSNNYVFCDLDN